jgi:hypothetical protein
MVKIEIDPELDHDEKTEPNLLVQRCASRRCAGFPVARFTWPGSNEQLACLLCAEKAREVADALGMHLQIRPYP